MSLTLRRAAIGTAAVALALGGCGLAGDTLRPGLAAQVGDTEISLDRVDDAATDLCDMITELAKDGNVSAVPGAAVRDNALQFTVLRELADQLAEEYDVAPGGLYRDSREQQQAELSELGVDSGLLDDLLPTITAPNYFGDIVQQIGQRELGLSAEEDTQGQGIEEGLRIAREWEAEHGLEVNPRFSDMSIGELGAFLETDVQELSVPVSDFAKQAAEGVDAQNSDSTYADSLPDSQRCG
ncbi:MAG: hypothetical protein M3237_17405 [Actinomycetota bacterium]|nr:hypothetical protein [Actinomycetota bacterium]